MTSILSILGVILPHDTYGTHLNGSGNTIDAVLEKKNFYAAAEVLSEIWSHTVINSHPVVCKVMESGSELKPEEPDPIWVSKHVRQHRYGIQIVKCLETTCCEAFETNWLDIFPKRFIPPPAVYQFGLRGLEIVEPTVYFRNPKKYKFASLSQRLITNLVPEEALKGKNGKIRPFPFDIYCESMQENIDQCVCDKCGLYWPSCAAKNRHLKAHKKDIFEDTFDTNDVLDEFDSEAEEEPEELGSTPMPIFEDIRSHLTSPFVPVTDAMNE